MQRALDLEHATFVVTDGDVTPVQMMAPLIKLQLWYRKAAEYRLAHALLTSRLNAQSLRLSLFILLLTTFVSCALVIDEIFAVPCAIISAIITALTGFSRFCDFPRRIDQHGTSARSFANVERELLTMLHASTATQQKRKIDPVAREFDGAMREMPILPRLRSFKDEQGNPLFDFITQAKVVEQSEVMHKGMLHIADIRAPAEPPAPAGPTFTL